MALNQMLLPSDVFDAPAFKLSLESGNTIQCCKTVIAATTQSLHARFRAG
jgi:hypothetical protein